VTKDDLISLSAGVNAVALRLWYVVHLSMDSKDVEIKGIEPFSEPSI